MVGPGLSGSTRKLHPRRRPSASCDVSAGLALVVCQFLDWTRGSGRVISKFDGPVISKVKISPEKRTAMIL